MPKKPKKTFPGHLTIDEASERVGVSRRTLYRLMEQLGIEATPVAAYLSKEEVERIKRAREAAE